MRRGFHFVKIVVYSQQAHVCGNEHLPQLIMENIIRHAIFHLPPQNISNSTILFAELLEKEGFKIFGNDHFIARVSREDKPTVHRSADDARRADTLITVGDYSKNDWHFHCTGNAYSIDIDVSSLENEIQMLWLVMIGARIRQRTDENNVSPEEVSNYAAVMPFLEALKNHKTAVAIRASKIASEDQRLKEAVADVSSAYHSSLLYSPFIDRLQELAIQNPGSIYAHIVAKLDKVPG